MAPARTSALALARGLQPHSGPSGHTHCIWSRRGLAQAAGSFGLCLTFPGRPGAVSTARAAARCAEASTPEDGPARPSVLQLRTLLRLLMSQPRTSCDKSAPAGKPVGGCRAPSE